jgi:hypothetical protein
MARILLKLRRFLVFDFGRSGLHRPILTGRCRLSDSLSILSEVTLWPLGVAGIFAFLLGFLIGRLGKARPDR